MRRSWILGTCAFVGQREMARGRVLRRSQARTKVAIQDRDRILPLRYRFGNIVGSMYWKPLYTLMEGALEVLVVDARHIKTVPGRKTDLRDAGWIADLLRHGLLQPSFIPDRAQCELRERTRYRTTLARERAAEVNRLQKVLEGANLKLASVVTEITGASGHDITSSSPRSRATPRRASWPSWPAGAGARRSRPWSGHWPVSFRRITASWSRSSWCTSISWMGSSSG
jgi:hypothetical protein